jgi:hypothetical protein
MVICILSLLPIVILIKIMESKIIFKMILYVSLFILILVEFKINYNYADRSNVNVWEAFFKTSVSSLPPNSILLTDKWEIFLSPGLYYQEVENIRKDVLLISPGGVILYNWYRDKQKVKIVDENNIIIGHKDLYIAHDVLYNLISKGIIFLPPKSSLVPYPYFYRLSFNNEYEDIDLVQFEFSLVEKSLAKYDAYINWLLPFMLESRILYEIHHNKIEKATYLYERLKRNFSNYSMTKTTILALIKNKIVTY